MECSTVGPRLFLGSCPETTDDLTRLRREHGITAVLTLQSDADRRLYDLDWPQLQERYRQLGIDVRQVPVQDQSEADLSRKLGECVQALTALLEQGHTVFVHCNIGNGRSPTVVAAWLHWTQGLGLQEAAESVRSHRQCQPNLDVIRSAEPQSSI